MFAVDTEGEPIRLDELDDATVPGLVVAPVTEAVKQVSRGLVARYLNRDALWAVQGFVLDGEMVRRLSADFDSPRALIHAVVSAGRQWVPVTAAPPPPE